MQLFVRHQGEIALTLTLSELATVGDLIDLLIENGYTSRYGRYGLVPYLVGPPDRALFTATKRLTRLGVFDGAVIEVSQAL